MIIDNQTNKVYFSKRLTWYKCWKELSRILDETGIDYDLLENTNDKWARDYMPIQLEKDKFVSYVYNPDYLQEDVTINTLVDAFVESAQGEPVFSDEWIEEWIAIQQIVREVAPSLQGFAEDSVRIARLLDSNNYVMHHSRRFDERYCPHYRIVRRDVFEQKIMPNDCGK